MQFLPVRLRIFLFSIAAAFTCMGMPSQSLQAQNNECSQFMDIYDEVDHLDSEVYNLWEENEELRDRYWEDEYEDGGQKELEKAVADFRTNWKTTNQAIKTWRAHFNPLQRILRGSCAALASEYTDADKQFRKIEAQMQKTAPLVKSLRANMSEKQLAKSFKKISKGLNKVMNGLNSLSNIVDDLEVICDECQPDDSDHL